MSRSRTASRSDVADSWSAFRTAIGWLGIAGRGEIVRAVFVGHPSVLSVMQAAQQWAVESSPTGSLAEADWCPALRERLQAYAKGERVDFKDFELELPDRTPFRDKVLATTRRLGYGATTTYGDLARRVGHPGAARAVGTVMSKNRFPILIPCHRVLAAGGKLGGYTSPSGTDLKQRLLDMEQTAHSVRVA
ncbi:MAG: methylated-DNA--[protein]-cysteine S-methyltransferase [Candidatus Saccharimonas sp.]|nr:methylated-DNA--[protein]-cysteine S-methyltransferase [Planctomycetaceae bacterium]